MKFNTKTRYGLRTVLELALNEEKEEGIFQKQIAVNQDVSIKYLDHIISALKKANLIENLAGKKSGYRLAKPSQDITIYDVYLAFEDELEIIGCLSPEGECNKKGSCVLRGFWCDLNGEIISRMSSVNLKKLADDHMEIKKTVFGLNFIYFYTYPT